MLQVSQQRPGHEHRGSGCRAISERAAGSSCAQRACPTPLLFALSSYFLALSPSIPAHRRHLLVSPIIPAHTQRQGVGVGNAMVTYLQYVGAPTFSFCSPEGVARRNQRGTFAGCDTQLEFRRWPTYSGGTSSQPERGVPCDILERS
jgi:hypothetical protein